MAKAEYDLKTAEAIFNAKRYIYVVFMCHLAIEKAIKGLYAQATQLLPPKTHNLLALIEKSNLDCTGKFIRFYLSPQWCERADTLS